MRQFLLGFLSASLLAAGLSWAQGYMGSDNRGTIWNVQPLPDGSAMYYDNHGNIQTIQPLPQIGPMPHQPSPC